MSRGKRLHHNHNHSHGSLTTRRLTAVLILTLAYTGAEIVGGLMSNSLALLADAGHMLTDNLALGIALFAAWSARRPPDPSRTYGYQRAEILAALANGIALVMISVYIVWEAWGRFASPPDVRYGLMGSVAVGGLVVNIIGAVILHGGQNQNMNMRAAYLHVLGDLLGSIGAIVAAVCIGLFGWTWTDPLASVVIAGIIVFSSTRLIFQSVNVLMEGTPTHIPIEEVKTCLASLDGVSSVHDLHVWCLSEGTVILTAHLMTDHSVRSALVLRSALSALEKRFGIDHATLQVEPPDFNILVAPDV
jgi:cobalt-zinc-cadmium efflux system protein